MRIKVNVKRSPKKAIKKIEQIAAEMKKDGRVKIGLPKGSNNYPDGTSVIMVGSVHEFGSPSRNVPERSFLRSTMNENSRKYKAEMIDMGLSIATGKAKSEESLRLLGLMVESDVKDKITTIDSPPLKSREGNPLVDTGHLRQTITFEVSDAN